MKGLLQVLAVMVGFLIASGEIARRIGDAHFIPLAFGDLAVAAALFFAAWRARNHSAAILAGAWGIFSGQVLVKLIVSLDYVIHDIPKVRPVFYSVILSLMLLLGLWACWTASRLVDQKLAAAKAAK